jgi:hypothetical protein
MRICFSGPLGHRFIAGIVKCFVQRNVFPRSPPRRHPNDKTIQSTLRTAPDLHKNVSLPVLFDSNGNSYTVSAQLDS